MSSGDSKIKDTFIEYTPEEIDAVVGFLRNIERLRIPDAEKVLGSLSVGHLPLSGFSAVRAYFDAVTELDIGNETKRDSIYEILKGVPAAELLRTISGSAESKAENDSTQGKAVAESVQVTEVERADVPVKEVSVPFVPEKEIDGKGKRKKHWKDDERPDGVYRITMSKLCVELITGSEAYAAVHNNHIITRDYLLEHFGDLLVVENESGTVWVHLAGSLVEAKEQKTKSPEDEAILQDIIHIIGQDGVLMR